MLANLKVVNLLLELGADINALGITNATALGVACQNAHLDVVRLLIARRADVNLGFPPIVLACIEPTEEQCKFFNLELVGLLSRKYEAVQVLLKNGANVHATDPETGLTALQLARYFKQPKLEALLLEHIEAKRV